MNKVFIDTNIFLDYIQQRPEGWREAEIIFFLAIHGDIEMLVSDLTIANMRYVTRKDIPLDLTIANMRYVTRKDIPLEQFYAIMKGLRPYYTIVKVGGKAVDAAYDLETKDYEDALQYYSAEQAEADCIVTRNLKDFDFPRAVETLEPKAFLKKYFPEEL